MLRYTRYLLLFILAVLPATYSYAGRYDYYSVITLENRTPYRIFYSYRWGGEDPNEWRRDDWRDQDDWRGRGWRDGPYGRRWPKKPKEQAEWRGQIPPYGSYIHWWTFAYPGQDYAPWFYLHLDQDPPRKWYRLGSFFSPDTAQRHGRVYYFETRREHGETEIVLRDKLYTY